VDDQPLDQRLATKYHTTVPQIHEQQAKIVALGAERGIDFRFDQAIGGNTFDAHRLLHLARVQGPQLQLKHRLGRAYFTDGEPIGDPGTLRRAGVDVGLDPDLVDAVLTGDAYADEVREDLEAATQIGISGVPFFVVDGRLGISGAQPPDALGDLIQQGWDSRTSSGDA
jgi:predicted DsbA family dithiol-disulfide isomerase